MRHPDYNKLARRGLYIVRELFSRPILLELILTNVIWTCINVIETIQFVEYVLFNY